MAEIAHAADAQAARPPLALERVVSQGGLVGHLDRTGSDRALQWLCLRAAAASSGSPWRRKNGATWLMSAQQLKAHGVQYAALFVLWAVAFGIGAAALGIKITPISAGLSAGLSRRRQHLFSGSVGSGGALQFGTAARGLGLGLLVSNTRRRASLARTGSAR